MAEDRSGSTAKTLLEGTTGVLLVDGYSGSSIAGLYSLVATCEARGANPFEYLVDVLARVQDHPSAAIDELLPGAWAAAREDD